VDPDIAAWNGVPVPTPVADVAADATKAEATNDDSEGPDTWREASEDVARLAWADSHDDAVRFLEWQDFDHPQLGPVQIGGWAPFALTEPPVAMRQKIADDLATFVLGLGEPLAQVEIASFTATQLSKNLWRVEAAVENNSLMPLATKAGERARTTRPARLVLALPPKAEIVAGEAKQLIRNLDGTGGRAEFTWLIHAKNPEQLGLTITTDHAGSASKACTKEQN
jgi:hypothetical protein